MSINKDKVLIITEEHVVSEMHRAKVLQCLRPFRPTRYGLFLFTNKLLKDQTIQIYNYGICR